MEKLLNDYGIYGLIIFGLVTWILLERKSTKAERKEWLFEIREIVRKHAETVKDISEKHDATIKGIAQEGRDIQRETNIMQRETNSVLRDQTNMVSRFQGIFDKIMKS